MKEKQYKMVKINLDWGNISLGELDDLLTDDYKIIDTFTEKIGDREWGDRWRIYFLTK